MTARLRFSTAGLRPTLGHTALVLSAALSAAPSAVAAQNPGKQSAAEASAQTGSQPATPKKKMWEFNGSLGFSQTSGNANAMTTNVTNQLKYSVVGWTVVQDLAFFYGEANAKVNTNFWNGGLRGERTVADRVALFLASRYDRNVLQGISSRFQQGFGVTVAAVDDKQTKLNVALGGSFFQQTLTPGSTAKAARAFPAARAAMDFRQRLSELAYVQQTAEYLPAIGDNRSAYFLNTESAIVAPISKKVALKVGYVIRYNSEPPVRNSVQLRTTDTFFSSGLTLSF